jgi:hypothetical protein
VTLGTVRIVAGKRLPRLDAADIVSAEIVVLVFVALLLLAAFLWVIWVVFFHE